ncbi:MAG: PKD domain-containing protein [Halobacteria archaeon]
MDILRSRRVVYGLVAVLVLAVVAFAAVSTPGTPDKTTSNQPGISDAGTGESEPPNGSDTGKNSGEERSISSSKGLDSRAKTSNSSDAEITSNVQQSNSVNVGSGKNGMDSSGSGSETSISGTGAGSVGTVGGGEIGNGTDDVTVAGTGEENSGKSFEISLNESEAMEGRYLNFDTELEMPSTVFVKNVYWNFGDGNVDKGLYPVHRYEEEGNFVVEANAYLSDGGTLVDEMEVKVEPKPNPTKNVEVGHVRNESELEVVIDAETFKPRLNTRTDFVYRSKLPPSESAVERHWYVDGNHEGKGHHFKHVFTEPGVHRVRLSAKVVDTYDGYSSGGYNRSDTVVVIASG